MATKDDIPRKNITLRLERDKHIRLKIVLAKLDRSLQSVFDAYLDRFLERYEKEEK